MVSTLYPAKKFDEDSGLWLDKQVCGDCDHELMNGGAWDRDPYEILDQRAWADYEYDPLYYPNPMEIV